MCFTCTEKKHPLLPPGCCWTARVSASTLMSSYRPCQETQSDTSELQMIICRIFPAFPSPHSQQQCWPRGCGAWRGLHSFWHCPRDQLSPVLSHSKHPWFRMGFCQKPEEKGEKAWNNKSSCFRSHKEQNSLEKQGLLLYNFFPHSSNSLFHSEIVLLSTGRSCGLLSLAQLPHPWEMLGLTQWETWLLEASASLVKDVWSFFLSGKPGLEWTAICSEQRAPGLAGHSCAGWASV